MKYELKKAKTEGVETLISGSSYGVNGIDYGYIDKAVNLSLGSQDLYYSLRGLYETCYANKNIKNIVLFTPSYYFFSDLSRTQNEDELTRVSKVYDLLFQDIHSCVLLPPKYDVLFKSEIFDIPFLMDLVVNQECSKGYFNSTLTRKSNATKTWEEKKKDWCELDESEKDIAAQKRATIHMKETRYINSLQENRIYLNDFVRFTMTENINLLLVAPPHSAFYNKYITEECKSAFYETIRDSGAEFLDLTTDPRFSEEDFVDADHLDDAGAIKMTQIISEYLKKNRI